VGEEVRKKGERRSERARGQVGGEVRRKGAGERE